MSLKFSVAIPAYNSAPHIGETLETILSQTHAPAEVIVVDDGSTDNTLMVAQRFGSFVTCHSIKNSGPGAARKTAIEKCTSEWIATCDSDDIWSRDHLARRVALIERFPGATFTFSDCTSTGPGSVSHYSRIAEAPHGWLAASTDQQSGDFVLFRDAYRAFLQFNPAFASGWAFRADVYRKMGGVNPRYSRAKAEDTEFARRFLLHPEAVVAGDLHATWTYRRHDSNYSATQWKNILGKADILADHLQDNVVPAQLREEVLNESIRTRIAAYNMAFWEHAYRDALAILRTIPPRHRSPKMYLRAALCKLRS